MLALTLPTLFLKVKLRLQNKVVFHKVLPLASVPMNVTSASMTEMEVPVGISQAAYFSRCNCCIALGAIAVVLSDDVRLCLDKVLHYKLHNEPWRQQLVDRKKAYGIPRECLIRTS